MKRLFLILMLISIMVLQSCNAKNQPQILEGKRILIAYFSHSGNNYVNGNIINLKVGNTEVIAKKISAKVSGDLFHIQSEKDYPKDYHQCTEMALQEQKSKARPVLKSKIDNMDSYDIIFLGYPNWWGTMPMPVWTFLESYDLKGKTIIPFCTHEGSAMGHSESDIKKLCPSSNVISGLAIRGSLVSQSDDIITEWLKELDSQL